MTARVARFLTLVVLSVAILVTGLTWFRSYSAADRLHGRIWGRASFLLGSKQGRIVAIGFRSHGHPNWWKWEILSYESDDALSFPVGPVQQYETALGVGWLRNPLYFVMPPVQELPDGTSVMFMGAASATLSGQGILIPHWLMALILITAFATTITKFRASLRGLFLWLTIVAVLLGLAAAAEQRKSKATAKLNPLLIKTATEQGRCTRAGDDAGPGIASHAPAA